MDTNGVSVYSTWVSISIAFLSYKAGYCSSDSVINLLKEKLNGDCVTY